MSGRDDTTTDGVEAPKYPEDHQGSHLLGVEERGAPLYYNAESNTVYTGNVDSGELMRDWADERLLDDQSLSDYLGSESSGWQSVSEYAKRHLPGFDAEDDTAGDGERDGDDGANRTTDRRPVGRDDDATDSDEETRLREDAPQLIGQAAGGSHIYYDEGGRTMFEGPSPDDLEAGQRVNEQPVGTRGVGGIVDAINDREGWDWLSEFAKERVLGGEAEEDDGANRPN